MDGETRTQGDSALSAKQPQRLDDQTFRREVLRLLGLIRRLLEEQGAPATPRHGLAEMTTDELNAARKRMRYDPYCGTGCDPFTRYTHEEIQAEIDRRYTDWERADADRFEAIYGDHLKDINRFNRPISPPTIADVQRGAMPWDPDMGPTSEQIAEFRTAARPLVEWLRRNFHPHVKVIVDSRAAEVVEGIARIVPSEKFQKGEK